MTDLDDLRAAAGRVRAFIDARTWGGAINVTTPIAETRGHELTVEDLRWLLKHAEQANDQDGPQDDPGDDGYDLHEQGALVRDTTTGTIGRVRCHGSELVTVIADHTGTDHACRPANLIPLGEPTQPGLDPADQPVTIRRHTPLSDAPCGVVTTPAGGPT